MVKEYQLKKEIIYDHLKCNKNLIIPTNDIEAWNLPKNKEYQWLYNKLKVAQSQELDCAPMGIKPINYPVICKPLINLHGMGLNAYKINNEYDYYKYKFLSGNFWSEYLYGEFHSIDIILIKGKIEWYVCFRGEQDFELQGAFLYWELLPHYKLNIKIKYWVETNLSDYTGIINVECINNFIIECHLRSGDINQIDLVSNKKDYKIMKNIINLYKNDEWETIENKLPKIYLIPIFVTSDNYIKLKDALYQDKVLLKIKEICKDMKCIQKDPKPDLIANPTGGIRIFNLTTDNLDKGIDCKNEIINYLSKESNRNDDTKVIVIVLIIMIVLLFLTF